MTTKTKAARSSGNYSRAKLSTGSKDKHIVAREYERGTLYGGILIAVFFGLLMLHAAVML